jgi:hypothetical protein
MDKNPQQEPITNFLLRQSENDFFGFQENGGQGYLHVTKSKKLFIIQ